MADYILRLNAIKAEDRLRVGGKAANLGELLRIGVQIPPGFGVSSNAYLEHMHNKRIVALLSELRGLDISAELFYDRLPEIEALLTDLPMPADVAKAIVDACTRLLQEREVSGALAVRSSATMEDTSVASFAGQFQTYLNVRQVEDVLDCVKKCWASVWVPKVVHYCRSHQISFWDLQMGVVVQQMIQPSTAGVVFTADPVTGQSTQLIIESCWGLGQGVVQGLVLTDTYVFKIDPGGERRLSIVDKVIVDKDWMCATESNTGNLLIVPVPEEQRLAPSLTDEEAFKLGEIALQIAGYYRVPQDIEWSIQNGRFYIIQSRPVTSVCAKVSS